MSGGETQHAWHSNLVGPMSYMRIPVDAGHQFRSMSGQDSGPCRATVPVDAGRGV